MSAERALQGRPARPRHRRLGVRRAAGRAGRGDRALQRPRAGDLRRADAHAGRLRGDPRRRGADRRADRRDRARARVPARGDARRARTSSPRTSSCSPSTARSCSASRASTTCSLRFEAAVAGVVPVVRVLRGVAGRHADRAHPRDRQRHDQLHPLGDGPRQHLRRRRSPRRSASATPRPTRATTSPAATRPRRWRSSRGSRSARPCTSTTCPTRGSSTCRATTSSTPASWASG